MSSHIVEAKKKAKEEKKKREKESKEKLQVGYVFEEELSLHKSHKKEHVERPERIWSIYLRLQKLGLLDKMLKIDGNLVSEEVLLLCHKEAYTMKIDQQVGMDDYDPLELVPLGRNKNSYTFQFDTYENKWTNHWAKLSAGSVIEVIDSLYADMIKSGFCIVRPPGHHAHATTAAGFWFFNNVGLAARYAQKNYGVKKVCIFDWDVHFGDGTSSIFESDPSVLFISPHRYENGKFYPGGAAGSAKKIGDHEGKGFNINIPFDVAGMGNDEYIYVWENLAFPIIEEFEPDLILISAGFDSAEGDPLGGFKLNPAGYSYMTQRLMELWPKVVAVLEGGYDLDAITNCSEGVVRSLLGQKLPIEEIGATESADQMYMNARPHDEAKRVVASVAKHVHKTWKWVEQHVIRSRKTTQEEMIIKQTSVKEMTDKFGEMDIQRKTTI